MNENLDFDPQAFKEFEHAGWEEVAANYFELFGITTAQATRPLLEAVGAGPGVRLLDVACGPGRLVAAAIARGATALGVDIAAAMVAEARNRYPGAEFRQGDAEELPFPDGNFDAVVCSFGLLHFSRPEQAIAEAHRVLAPGGRYVFTAWSEKSAHRELIEGAIEAHGDPNVPLPAGPPIFIYSDPEECNRALLSAGFADPAVSEIPIVVRSPNTQHVLDMMYKSTVRGRALLMAQTPAARERINQAIVEGARRHRKEGAIEVPRPAVMAFARKP